MTFLLTLYQLERESASSSIDWHGCELVRPISSYTPSTLLLRSKRMGFHPMTKFRSMQRGSKRGSKTPWFFQASESSSLLVCLVKGQHFGKLDRDARNACLCHLPKGHYWHSTLSLGRFRADLNVCKSVPSLTCLPLLVSFGVCQRDQNGALFAER